MGCVCSAWGHPKSGPASQGTASSDTPCAAEEPRLGGPIFTGSVLSRMLIQGPSPLGPGCRAGRRGLEGRWSPVPRHRALSLGQTGPGPEALSQPPCEWQRPGPRTGHLLSVGQVCALERLPCVSPSQGQPRDMAPSRRPVRPGVQRAHEAPDRLWAAGGPSQEQLTALETFPPLWP